MDILSMTFLEIKITGLGKNATPLLPHILNFLFQLEVSKEISI